MFVSHSRTRGSSTLKRSRSAPGVFRVEAEATSRVGEHRDPARDAGRGKRDERDEAREEDRAQHRQHDAEQVEAEEALGLPPSPSPRAGVSALLPTSIETRPDTPPMAASSFGDSNSTSAPEATRYDSATVGRSPASSCLRDA